MKIPNKNSDAATIFEECSFMIRLLCDARGKFRENFLNKMIEFSNGEIELSCHLGYENADYNGTSLQWLNTKVGKSGSIIGHNKLAKNSLTALVSDSYDQILEKTVEQLYRTSPDYTYRAHNIRHVQDYLDYFHITVDAAAQIIEERNITHALFYCVPHLFYDTVFYEVAKALGVNVTILSWSQFEGRFFSMKNAEDLGNFDPRSISAPPYEIEQGSVPDIFYMEDNWQKEGMRGKISAKAVVNLIRYLLYRDPLSLMKPVSLAKNVNRISNIYGQLPDWRDPFSKFFHTNELAYFEYLAQFETQKIDLSQKYIYVPLHNQPEMSTSALGGRYRDQALMIEALARDMPDDWKIFVKENPRQGSYARGPMFFHRLKRIPNLEIMPSNANTHALSKNAQFVASVTGTVGWEAIRQGTPAMVFGAAWYGSLEGVIKYEPGLDYEKVAAMNIDHEKLQRDAGGLVARTHEGVIEQLFFPLIPNLDHARNIENVARTSLQLIRGELDYSFQPRSQTTGINSLD